MDDLARRIERIRGRVQPPWSPQRQADILRGVQHRRRRARLVRVAGAALAVLLLVGLGLGALRPRPLRFPDGSVAVLQPGSQVQTLPVQAGRVAVALVAGSARFAVVPDRRRVFRVEAGPVSVEVLGTQFSVTREQGRTLVAVEEGRVRVRWAGGETVLGAGERGSFPPAAVPPLRVDHDGRGTDERSTDGRGTDERGTDEHGTVPPAAAPAAVAPLDPAAAPVDPAAAPVDPAARPAPPPDPPAPRPALDAAGALQPRRPAPPPGPRRWQDLAQDGDYEEAFGALRQAPAPRDEPQELLLAADVARLSHHPEEAVAPLTQLLERHRDDRRAPLAAFTLGRLLLDALGRPGPAAAAFQTVQELDLQGPLYQDALAREVEAWSRAGDEVLSRQRALEYVRRYPTGPRLRAVRRHGGLE